MDGPKLLEPGVFPADASQDSTRNSGLPSSDALQTTSSSLPAVPSDAGPSTEAALAIKFFSQPKYSDFKYDQTKPAEDEFSRLCKYLGWSHWRGNCPPMEKARKEFEKIMGVRNKSPPEVDRTELDKYRDLCRSLPPAPIRVVEPEKHLYTSQTTQVRPIPTCLPEVKVVTPASARQPATKATQTPIYKVRVKVFVPPVHQPEIKTETPQPSKRKWDGSSSWSSSGASNRRFKKDPQGTPLIDDFFSQFIDFDYNPSRPVMAEFYRLCNCYRWKKNDRDRENARRELREVLVGQFNQTYGKDGESMEAWRALCEIVGIHPVPDTMEECREAVRSIHVNIVDLVDVHRYDTEVQVFPTANDLAAYTRTQGKFFPMDDAKAGGVLKYLLRHILQPELNGDERNNMGPPRKRHHGYWGESSDDW